MAGIQLEFEHDKSSSRGQTNKVCDTSNLRWHFKACSASAASLLCQKRSHYFSIFPSSARHLLLEPLYLVMVVLLAIQSQRLPFLSNLFSVFAFQVALVASIVKSLSYLPLLIIPTAFPMALAPITLTGMSSLSPGPQTRENSVAVEMLGLNLAS